MTLIDTVVIAAYRSTDYIVFEDEGQIILRIDAPDLAIDSLLMRHGAQSAIMITAWNPQSAPLNCDENNARQERLWQWIADHRLFALAAEGRDPSGTWPAEESCLIFDIDAETAAELGRQFDQNAIVRIASGAAPELILLR
jgi:hypothetical protein